MWLQIWAHLLGKSLMGSFIFCVANIQNIQNKYSIHFSETQNNSFSYWNLFENLGEMSLFFCTM